MNWKGRVGSPGPNFAVTSSLLAPFSYKNCDRCIVVLFGGTEAHRTVRRFGKKSSIWKYLVEYDRPHPCTWGLNGFLRMYASLSYSRCSRIYGNNVYLLIWGFLIYTYLHYQWSRTQCYLQWSLEFWLRFIYFLYEWCQYPLNLHMHKVSKIGHDVNICFKYQM